MRYGPRCKIVGSTSSTKMRMFRGRSEDIKNFEMRVRLF